MTLHQGKKMACGAALAVASGLSALSPAAFGRSALAERCEAALGGAMLSLARAEGHRPALASEIRAALDAGMTEGEISRCLDLSRYEVASILENPQGNFKGAD